jgi:hypothetical protein
MKTIVLTIRTVVAPTEKQRQAKDRIEQELGIRPKPNTLLTVDLHSDDNLTAGFHGTDEPPCATTIEGDLSRLPRLCLAWQKSELRNQAYRHDAPALMPHLTRATLDTMTAAELHALAASTDAKPGDERDQLFGWLGGRIRDLVASVEPAQVGSDADTFSPALAKMLATLGKFGKKCARVLSKDEPWEWWKRDVREGQEPDASSILALRMLADVGWRDEVKPRLEREAEERRRRESTPIRVPQPMAKTMTEGRAATVKSRKVKTSPEDETWANHVSLAIPGAQLALPLPASIAVNNGGTLQSVLTGGLIRTYVIAWALCAERPNGVQDGEFEWDVDRVLRHYLKRVGKPSGTLREDLQSDLDRLCEFRVVRAGDWEVKGGPEPLVSVYRQTTTGRTVYRHSGVVKLFMANDFAQIPRQVVTLPADDVPLALGLSAVIRGIATVMLKSGNVHDGTLEQLARVCGEDVDSGVRKYGQHGPGGYWKRVSDKLERVARDGGLGSVTLLDGATAASGAPVRLKMSDDMAAAYAPLLAKANQHKANEGAKIPRLLHRKAEK